MNDNPGTRYIAQQGNLWACYWLVCRKRVDQALVESNLRESLTIWLVIILEILFADLCINRNNEGGNSSSMVFQCPLPPETLSSTVSSTEDWGNLSPGMSRGADTVNGGYDYLLPSSKYRD
jgi:hypothetical protein